MYTISLKFEDVKTKVLLTVGAIFALRSLSKYFLHKKLLAFDAKGKVAIVTGSASGIGYEICLLLAEKGWKVYGFDVNESGLLALAKVANASNLSITTCVVDITNTESCDAVLQRLLKDTKIQERGVDLLINNAGVIYPSPMLDTPWTKVQQMYAVNVLGPIYLSRILLPHLLRSVSGGHIVNMSSMAGRAAWPWQGVYSCTKFSLEGFSDCLRREVLASDLPLQVTAICPGGVRTALSQGVITEREKWCADNPDSVFQPAAQRSLDSMRQSDSLHDYFMLSPRAVAQTVCVAAAQRCLSASPKRRRGTLAVRLEPATPSMQMVRWLLLRLPVEWADRLTTYF